MMNIVYEDEAILVVHKPAGIATETSAIGKPDLVSELKNYRKDKKEVPYIGMVHRLDQPVEGLLVFGKTKEATASLSAQLLNGRLGKSYTAKVYGHIMPGKKGNLADYLLKDARTNTSKVVPKGTTGAKEARLSYEGMDANEIDGDWYSTIRVEIETGRHHQIRVQMSHAGYPLLGDSKYGNGQSLRMSVILDIKSTALVADRIALFHPVTKKRMEFKLI